MKAEEGRLIQLSYWIIGINLSEINWHKEKYWGGSILCFDIDGEL
jgi:hypothetical protein